MLRLLVCLIFLLLQSSIQRIKYFYCAVAQHEHGKQCENSCSSQLKIYSLQRNCAIITNQYVTFGGFLSLKIIIETACAMLEACQGGGEFCAQHIFMQMKTSIFSYLTISMYLNPFKNYSCVSISFVCVVVFKWYTCFVHLGYKERNGLGTASSSYV